MLKKLLKGLLNPKNSLQEIILISMRDNKFRALLKNKKITVKEAAKRLKVDPSTLYRYLPGGRSAIKEGIDG